MYKFNTLNDDENKYTVLCSLLNRKTTFLYFTYLNALTQKYFNTFFFVFIYSIIERANNSRLVHYNLFYNAQRVSI